MCAAAVDTPIWTIGERGARHQFNPAFFSMPGTAPPPFVVGVSDPALAWPRFHPGPFNGSTAFETCTASILFSLAEAPVTPLELVVDVRSLVGSCPHLLIDCNGRHSLALVEPLPENRGEVVTQPPLNGGVAEVVAVLPSTWLRAGENCISLAAVELEEPAPGEVRPAQPSYGAWFGSVLEHCGLLLRATGHDALAPTVAVRSLPLFEHAGGGGAAPLVELVVRVPAGFSSAQARVEVDGRVHDLTLDLGINSGGDVRRRFAIADVDEPREATVELLVDGTRTVHSATLDRQRRWTVHLVPHVHLDVGYTDYQAKVFEVHSRNLDRAAALLDATPDYAFSVDGSLAVERFFDSRAPAAVEHVTAWMRRGRIAVNAFAVLFLTGLASLEECYRAAWFSADLRDRHGIPMRYANLTDVPSYSMALPSMLRDMGIDHFVGIQNHTRAATSGSDVLHRASPFRWRGADGAEVLAYFSDQYSQLRFLCGDPPLVAGVADALSRFLQRHDRDDDLCDIPLVGIASDNEDLGHGEADLVRRWNARYAYPRILYSTIPAYMEAVEASGAQLPVVEGDGGSFWEDRAGTNALMIAGYRDAQALLPAAETLGLLTARLDRRLRAPGERLRSAWDALLLGCEHSWSATHSIAMPHEQHSVDELAWKVHQVEDARRRAGDEMHRAMSRLGEMVDVPTPALVVFNPLSWSRGALLDLELADHIAVHDADGDVVPLEVTGSVDGLDSVRLRVADIPAFGYRSFTLVRGDADSAGHLTPTVVEASVVDTGRHTVTVDPLTRRVTSIVHAATGRELVDAASGHGFGEVLYVTGGGDSEDRGIGEQRTRLFDHDLSLPQPVLSIRPQEITAHSVRRTHWGWSIDFVGAAETLPLIRTQLRLFDDDDRIELDVRLRKVPELAKESVYVAFPFALRAPTIRYDRQQGWVDPARDHHAGACNEWFVAQHAVVLEDPTLALTWSSAEAPVFTVGDVVRGTWAATFEPSTATVFSWVMNNYWFTDCPAQQEGEVLLRYAVHPAPGRDDAASARFGREHRARARVADVTWLDRADTSPRPLPASGASLLALDLPANVAATLHLPRTGTGLGLRLQETAGRDAHVDLGALCRPGEELCTCTALDDAAEYVEDDTVVLAPHSVRSFLVRPMPVE